MSVGPYGLYITGESMAPEFEPGDIAESVAARVACETAKSLRARRSIKPRKFL